MQMTAMMITVMTAASVVAICLFIDNAFKRWHNRGCTECEKWKDNCNHYEGRLEREMKSNQWWAHECLKAGMEVRKLNTAHVKKAKKIQWYRDVLSEIGSGRLEVAIKKVKDRRADAKRQADLHNEKVRQDWKEKQAV